MYGRIDAVQLFGAVVARVAEDGFVPGANEREGSVEHDGCRLRRGGILKGVADGDGAHGCGESAAHAGHGERHIADERQQGCCGAAQAGLPLPRERTDAPVAAPRGPKHHETGDNDIPAAQHLGSDNTQKVVFMGKLAHHRPCRAATRIGEVKRIANIAHHNEHHRQHEEQTQDEIVAASGLPLCRQRQQRGEGIGRHEVEQRRGVKEQGACEKTSPGLRRQLRRQKPPVLRNEHCTAEPHNEVSPQEIEEKRAYHGHKNSKKF